MRRSKYTGVMRQVTSIIILFLNILLLTPAKAYVTSADIKLDVLQYNVQFLTPWNIGEIPGHWPNVEGRAIAIGKAIACYDFVTLEETVNNDRRNQIIRAMEEEAPNCGKPSFFSNGRYFDVVDGPDLPDGFRIITPDDIADLLDGDLPLVDDELTIVSRLPIISVHSHIFSASSGIDSLAAKGVLHARLWRGGNASATDAIDVFATHLQAGDSGVRRDQVEELTDFIRRHSQPDVPIMLLGDFNINGVPIDYDSEGRPIFGEEYTRLMDFLEELDLVDIGVHLGGTNQDSDPSKHRKQRIDHIFVSSTGIQFNEDDVRVEEFFDDRYTTLSDHAAVEATITWQEKPPVSFPPLDHPKQLNIEVTELRALSSDSCNVFMDFYGELELNDGATREIEGFGIHEGNHIGPDWSITKEIQPQVPAVTSIVKIWDEDDLVCGGGDDTVDVNPLTDQKHVQLLVNFVNHQVYLTDNDGHTVRALAELNRPIFVQGSNGDENARMVVVVTAEALDIPPPQQPPPIDRPRDVTVTVERLTATSEDSCEEMEFYGEIAMSRGAFASMAFGIVNGNDIFPNWSVEGIAIPGITSVDATIKVREEDDFFCGGGDDDVDVNPDPAQKVAAVRVDLTSGNIWLLNEAGDIYAPPVGIVGRSITLQGFDGDETAKMTFRIDVAESDAPLPLPIERNRYTVLTVNRLVALSSDSCEEMEFYAKEMRLENGASASDSFGIMEGDDIQPNWSVNSRVESGVNSFDAFINIDEEDDLPCGGGDDDVDINPVFTERDLRLRVYLQSNEIKIIDSAGNPIQAPGLPEVIGFVGRPITLQGTQDDETAQITFQVDALLYCEVFAGAPSCLIPSLVADINSLSFNEHNAEKGITFSIENKNAPTPAEWRASADQPWVKFSRTSGETPSNITVTIDRSVLAGGSHQATVTLSSPSAPGERLEIPLTVSLPADRVISDLDIMVFEPSHDTSDLTLSLSNRNDPFSISWDAVVSEPWIHLSSNSGVTPAELIVSVDGTGLSAGTHQGVITITYGEGLATSFESETIPSDTIEVPVEVRIPADALVLDPSEILFNTHAGITNTLITVGNANTLKAVRWQATTSQPWLKLNPPADNTPSEVEVQFESAELLPEGEYVADITFSSPDIPDETWVLPVKVDVQHFKSFQSFAADNPGPDLVVQAADINRDGSVEVIIENVGALPTTYPFWVDLCFDPDPIPTQANDICLDGRSKYGLVWHIDPYVQPGESITLTIGDPDFRPHLSRIPGSMPGGTPVYVQVDSANTEMSFGGVHEMHEVAGSGLPYNNIVSIALEEDVIFETAASVFNQSEGNGGNELPAR